MVCEVCSVDRSDESGELVILDYPRYLAADSPCPNCGCGAFQDELGSVGMPAKLVIERPRCCRRAR